MHTQFPHERARAQTQRKATVFSPLPRQQTHLPLVHSNAIQSITKMLRINPSRAGGAIPSAFKRKAVQCGCYCVYVTFFSNFFIIFTYFALFSVSIVAPPFSNIFTCIYTFTYTPTQACSYTIICTASHARFVTPCFAFFCTSLSTSIFFCLDRYAPLCRFEAAGAYLCKCCLCLCS